MSDLVGDPEDRFLASRLICKSVYGGKRGSLVIVSGITA